ncbi:MAG: helix-turn-helix transcriptional regulator [Candidatus Paceibacterota bacterium]|jgi:ribosome-binding protein aMBF1 (putative translation factor)
MKQKNAIKTYTFDQVLNKYSRSDKFKKAYSEEIARLRLAEQIKQARSGQKLTQKGLAKRIKMPQSVIARIESGTHGYSLGTLYRIATAFNKEIRLV